MANANGWGDGASNNDIGWGKGADNAIGWGSVYSVSSAGATDIVGTPAVDPDAQAFITAASITDPTQQSAINQLVVDLKGYNIWTKMKAVYPFVGGTASTHKFNLISPLDTDGAFRLVFSGGVTHSFTGALFNGTNGFADTKLASSGTLAQNSTHFSAYSRTNNTSGGYIMANGNAGASGESKMYTRWFDNNCYSGVNTFGQVPTANSDSRGYFIANRISGTQHSVVIRGTKIDFNTNSSGLKTDTFRICSALSTAYDNKEIAFSSIGDGLTNTDMTNLTTAVQTFQTTLGRSIGTQTVSDADAQAFVTAADIQDQVEANAVNNLVIGLKADGLWTKMKACYPMVGGSSSTMKYNLKNPLDTDAAFRLVFNGGWTFSSTGATPNGTNAYADTKFNDSTHFTSNTNGHISAYIRTDFPVAGNFETIIGCSTDNNATRILTRRGTGLDYLTLTDNFSAQAAGNYSDKLKGQYLLTKDGTNRRYFKNSTLLHTAANGTNGAANRNIYLGAENYPVVSYYSNRELAFATIGDNLTNTDSANLYTRIQNMQTALNRNV